ncbi:MAG TPA: sigma-70 family RNA polymerase sigma factor [Longimicrobiaceae bacterium]|nr:sigma-70 family RNA polymerase sigma factor [Longimicrobiaceae bacterium]
MLHPYAPWPAPDVLAGLVSEAQRGPASAVDTLLAALRPALVSYYSGRITGDLAEDLAQAALLRIHGALPGIEPERADRFIATIARNVLRSGYAQRGRALRRWAPEQLAEGVASPAAADRHLEYKELARAVKQLAEADLPPKMQQVVLGLLRDETPAEIAARLGISQATVRMHLMRARAVLRRELRPYLDPDGSDPQDRTG